MKKILSPKTLSFKPENTRKWGKKYISSYLQKQKNLKCEKIENSPKNLKSKIKLPAPIKKPKLICYPLTPTSRPKKIREVRNTYTEVKVN